MPTRSIVPPSVKLRTRSAMAPKSTALPGLVFSFPNRCRNASSSVISAGASRSIICLLAAMFGAVTFAAVIGLALPTVFRLLQKDPRVAAGPIALAAADMATLVLYFNLARYLIR